MLYYTKVLYTMLSYIIVYDNCRIHFGTVEGFQASQTSGQDMHEEDDANTYAKAHYARFRNPEH